MVKETINLIIRKFIGRLSKEFNIKKVILFGSQARGDVSKNSDIDLIIVSDDFKTMKSFERSSAMYKYWDALIPKDFICYTQKEFEYLKKRISLVSESIKE